MNTLSGDIFDIVKTHNSSYIIDYLDKQLRDKGIIFIDISLLNDYQHNEIIKKISELVQDIILTLCDDNITRIDLSYSLFLSNATDTNRYIITKCRNRNSSLVIVKTRYGFIFARGSDAMERIFDEILNDIKSDIIMAEVLAKICDNMRC